MNIETFKYDNRIVRAFAIATVVWGIVGMLVGLLAAVELFFPGANLNLQFITFGRIRPLHTNAVIFAFVGNGMFMGIYYSLQRLCKARMFSDFLSWVNFWGWQLIIVSAALTLPLGFTTSKEYAELEWPIKVAIAVVWIAFAINLFGTIVKRREKHMYVAIWFYISTVVTITVLHVTNSMTMPAGFLKSYSMYAGVQDALVQWWYGHNAVAFFLTTPYLGLMYYFLPKAANRPIFSYRLSIIHFWALVFHLHLGRPASSALFRVAGLGAVARHGLLAHADRAVLGRHVERVADLARGLGQGPPGTHVEIHGGGGHRLRHGHAGRPAHVHQDGQFPVALHGLDHCPRARRRIGLERIPDFFRALLPLPPPVPDPAVVQQAGQLSFLARHAGHDLLDRPDLCGGHHRGLMWKQFNKEGFLQYPNFLETIVQVVPMFRLRAIGGTLYFIGVLMMAYNLYRTAKAGQFEPETEAQAPALEKTAEAPHGKFAFHRLLEGKPLFFTVLAIVAILIGGIVEIIPMYLIKANVPTIASVKPYTPLEVMGRDIYIREGCLGCHSQMIRPFRSETERYGEYSKAGEYVYDHPFLWGSERKGPDLAREGGKYSAAWHFNHMDDPRTTSPGSIMPRYSWLLSQDLDTNAMPAHLAALRRVGVPYPDGFENGPAQKDLQAQAGKVAAELKKDQITCDANKEIVALIAYLQRLGTDIKKHGRQIINRSNTMEEKIISSMSGVGIYGVISICIFFAFFTGMLAWAFTAKASYLKKMSSLPLDGGEKNNHDNRKAE